MPATSSSSRRGLVTAAIVCAAVALASPAAAADRSATLHAAKARDQAAQKYDAVCAHILMMADAPSDGIIKQFPDKFKAS